LVYGLDGSAYATAGNGNAQIVQVDPTTGAELRVVAANLTCPAGLTVDPLSGDLFFDDQCTGGGTDNASIFRIIDPAGTNTARPTSVVVYATLPATPNGGMAFAPNGTLYAVSGYYVNPDAPVEQISGTNATTVTVTPVAGVTSNYGLAIGAANADGSVQSLIVRSSGGALLEEPLSNPSAATTLVSSNAPNPGVTGPDGCMYAAAYDTIYKIATSAGNCTFAPTSPAPSIKLAPATVSPNPAQGSTQTFVASLTNVSTLAGVPVLFEIGGANPLTKLVDTDAEGNATLTYTGTQVGADTLIASTTAGSTAVTSGKAGVTWVAGKHVASLSLNLSAQGGTINTPAAVLATLTDVSVAPRAALSGQTIAFTLGSSSCSATTNSSGMATCSLTPSTGGAQTLTASFAGSGSLVAATKSILFTVAAAPVPAPTVTLSVSPTTIAAGSSATLTWSSTNATGCSASGSWSGSETTSGSQTVTPVANGSYSYTLSCTGTGGTATATAALAATLVSVTVTAKSGGGALSWPALLVLGLLVAVRMTSSARADSLSTPQSGTPTDPYYVGLRVGSMPLRQDSTDIDQGLSSRGFPAVTATRDTSGAAGTVFAGYEFTPHTALEIGYTFRNSTTYYLRGTIPSTSQLMPLLQDTTDLMRGYGNLFSLSYSGHFEVLPRISLEPRFGGFFWSTRESAFALDERVDTTRQGGGVTAGLTAEYRLWRGLEVGISADYFRGVPHNIATLYAGTLEWRFGS
jgi:hypothetical protein